MYNRITIINGHGIGPEIMKATIDIIGASGASLECDFIEVGGQVYQQGHSNGIAPDSWDKIKQNKIILKGPISTPQGEGYKSINITLRKKLALYANVRPAISYYPFVNTNFHNMDVVVIRENEEDLFSGIEYRQSQDTFHSLKLFTRKACEKIIRYAFEYAIKNQRKSVTCFTKDNIMKFTDGLFHQAFEQISKEYPEINSEHQIIDIAAAKLADNPENYDVIVTSNLYGDIISDISAEISGSIGLAGSANIGEQYALFEAMHGSAPKHAGKNIANPSGLLNAAIMMLNFIGKDEVANVIYNAWLKTIEDGIHTKDICSLEYTKMQVGTSEFANEVIKRFGKKPELLKPYRKHSSKSSGLEIKKNKKIEVKRILTGIDIVINWRGDAPGLLADEINKMLNSKLILKLISINGLKVWPEQDEELHTSEEWSLRFLAKEEGEVLNKDLIEVLEILDKIGFSFLRVNNLYKFDDKLGYSLCQGE